MKTMVSSNSATCDAPLTILIVDDCIPFREGLRKIFGHFPVLTIIGEAGDGNAAVNLAFQLLPLVIIMDVEMPHLNGIEATRRIKRFLPHACIIAVSSRDDAMTQRAMTLAGCCCFLAKEHAHTLPDLIARQTGRHLDIRSHVVS